MFYILVVLTTLISFCVQYFVQGEQMFDDIMLFILSLFGYLAAFCLIIGIPLGLYSIHVNAKTMENIENWKKVEFREYVSSMNHQHYKVIDYQLSDGKYSITLDTNNSKKIVTTSNVKFVKNEHSYVLAKWIDALSVYGIEDGYYDVTFYLEV